MPSSQQRLSDATSFSTYAFHGPSTPSLSLLSLPSAYQYHPSFASLLFSGSLVSITNYFPHAIVCMVFSRNPAVLRTDWRERTALLDTPRPKRASLIYVPHNDSVRRGDIPRLKVGWRLLVPKTVLDTHGRRHVHLNRHGRHPFYDVHTSEMPIAYPELLTHPLSPIYSQHIFAYDHHPPPFLQMHGKPRVAGSPRRPLDQVGLQRTLADISAGSVNSSLISALTFRRESDAPAISSDVQYSFT